MSHLIETVYNLLWGDLFTLPVGGGIGISLMACSSPCAPGCCPCGCSGI